MAVDNGFFKKRKLTTFLLCIFLVICISHVTENLYKYTVEGTMPVESVTQATDGNIYIYVNHDGRTVCLMCDKGLITDVNSIICDKDVLYDISFESSTLNPESGKLISINANEFIDNRK